MKTDKKQTSEEDSGRGSLHRLVGLSDSVMNNLPADVRHSITTAGLNYPPLIKRVKKLGEKI